MDVVCQRCRAEYDFDDALISERGTTVRCTSCGFQFKVFPPEAGAQAEKWTLTPARHDEDPVVFESLRELQRAIARGEVEPEDHLSRGDGPPRRVDEIVELMPLLRQGKSSVPPPVRSNPPPAASGTDEPHPSEEAATPFPRAARLPAEATNQPRAPTGTVMGIATPKKPAVLAPPPPGLDQAPAPPSDAEPPHETGARPRIRSALSVGPAALSASQVAPHDDANGDGSSDAPPSSDPARSSVPPPRISLRSTLGGRDSELPPAPDSPRNLPGAVRARGVPPELPHSSTSAPHVPSEPRISSPAQWPRDVTPTPSAMMRTGRESSRDSIPVSSVPMTNRGRAARSIWVVVAVLAGAGAFTVIVGRDRLFPSDSPAQSASRPVLVTQGPDQAALLTAAEEAVLAADEAWLRVLLASDAEREARSSELEAALRVVDQKLAELGPTAAQREPRAIWLRVNLLRMNGDLGEARRAFSSLPEEARDDALSLALLDLAEVPAVRPYPLVLRRLGEAATGERGRFRARSALVYALAESGKLDEARASHEALGALSGGKESPLYADLAAYLARQGPAAKEPEDAALTAPAPAEATPAEATPPEPPTVDARPAEPKPVEKPKPAEPKPAEKAKPQVSDAVKAKVAEADALWGQGNREGAVRLYKQVVAEIGTSHFLGQRSNARIAQAEREMGSP